MKVQELEQEAKNEISEAQKAAVKKEIKNHLDRIAEKQRSLDHAKEAYKDFLESDVEKYNDPRMDIYFTIPKVD